MPYRSYIKSGWKPYHSSHWKLYFKSTVEHWNKRYTVCIFWEKNLKVFGDTENDIKTIILNKGVLGTHGVNTYFKNQWIWRGCHGLYILCWIFSPKKVKGWLHFLSHMWVCKSFLASSIGNQQSKPDRSHFLNLKRFQESFFLKWVTDRIPCKVRAMIHWLLNVDLCEFFYLVLVQLWAAVYLDVFAAEKLYESEVCILSSKED